MSNVDPARARALAEELRQLVLGTTGPELHVQVNSGELAEVLHHFVFFAPAAPVVAPSAAPLDGKAHFHYRLAAESGYEQTGVYENITPEGFGRIVEAMQAAHLRDPQAKDGAAC